MPRRSGVWGELHIYKSTKLYVRIISQIMAYVYQSKKSVLSDTIESDNEASTSKASRNKDSSTPRVIPATQYPILGAPGQDNDSGDDDQDEMSAEEGGDDADVVRHMSPEMRALLRHQELEAYKIASKRPAVGRLDDSETQSYLQASQAPPRRHHSSENTRRPTRPPLLRREN